MKFNEPSRKKPGAALSLALIIVLLVVFFYYASLDGIIAALRVVYLPWFVLALVISIVSSFINCTSFWFMLRKQEITISLLQLLGINMGVRFYSFFSPISSVGAIMRFQRIIPAGKIAEGLAAFGANRMFEIIFPLSMGVIWTLVSANQHVLNPIVFIVYLLALVLVLWLAFRVGDLVVDWTERRRPGTASKTLAWIYIAIKKIFRALSTYRAFSSTEMLTFLGIALVGEFVSLSGYVLLVQSLNIPISFVDLGWIRSLMMLAAFTSITFPGGFGMREVSAVILMTSLGIGAEKAAAFSLLLYARSMFTALLGGAMELVFNIKTFAEHRKAS